MNDPKTGEGGGVASLSITGCIPAVLRLVNRKDSIQPSKDYDRKGVKA